MMVDDVNKIDKSVVIGEIVVVFRATCAIDALISWVVRNIISEVNIVRKRLCVPA